MQRIESSVQCISLYVKHRETSISASRYACMPCTVLVTYWLYYRLVGQDYNHLEIIYWTLLISFHFPSLIVKGNLKRSNTFIYNILTAKFVTVVEVIKEQWILQPMTVCTEYNNTMKIN